MKILHHLSRSLIYAGLVLMIVMLLWQPAVSVQAAADYWVVFTFSEVSCTTAGITFRQFVTINYPTDLTVSVQRYFNNIYQYNFSYGVLAGTGGPYDTGVYTIDVSYASLTIPYTVQDKVTLLVGGNPVATGQIDYSCGAASASAYGVVGAPPTTDPGNPDAPLALVPITIPIPRGFELRTITCDTGLYNAPGGQLVENAKITAGQTWYVNPIPVQDAAGVFWSQVFVGDWTVSYLPYGCAYPAGSGLVYRLRYIFSNATCDSSGFRADAAVDQRFDTDVVFRGAEFLNGMFRYDYKFSVPKNEWAGQIDPFKIVFDTPVSLPYHYDYRYVLYNQDGTAVYVAQIAVECTTNGFWYESTGAPVTQP
jgi:hypothetical protein